MHKTKFIKEQYRKGIDIIEGWEKPGKLFSIKRFICQVAPQETESETDQLANDILHSLEKARKWDELDERIAKFYPEGPIDDSEDNEYDDGLVGIGEAAASAFGYL